MLPQKYETELAKLRRADPFLNPVAFLNEMHGKSFVLPFGKRYASFGELEELFPSDFVCHGTSLNGFNGIRKSGKVDTGETNGKIFLTKYTLIAKKYTGKDGTGALLFIQVRDVPGGISPPNHLAKQNGEFLFYGNMSGIGVAHKPIPYEKIQAVVFLV